MSDSHAARYVRQLRAQAKTAEASPKPAEALSCPYCSEARMFESDRQLWDHATLEHAPNLKSLGDPNRARIFLREEGLRISSKALDTFSEATAGGGSTPDLAQLSLLESNKDAAAERYSPTFRQSPPRSKKRPAADLQSTPVWSDTRRTKQVGPTQILDSDHEHSLPDQAASDAYRPRSGRTHDPSQETKGATGPYLFSTPNQSSEDWSVIANKSQLHQHSSVHGQPIKRPARSPGRTSPTNISAGSRNPPVTVPPRHGTISDIQRIDPRYPGLLLQPESRPISQEQLASEVKSIYAGLTMVETKCIHVDRAQASAAQEADTDPNSKLANDHWQALIALHRTLLHEHHDFFLASQHPSASPALRRLASKYSMPARMWKHGIHSFLELLRRRLPESLDYMLAFIYLAYQMMALLYETVPAFEDTWIECLGDLGRYRMAIEDEDVRDREIWASVARSWYSKAADKNPTVGRLYHHLAILARPNALQQLYYYARSLTSVKPFASARESILTLLDPILGKAIASYTHALPIDTNFIQAHGILFEKLPEKDFDEAVAAFQTPLDNHIGRVTAKWKEQGVYIAVTNIAGLFDYGADSSILRALLILHAKQIGQKTPTSRSSSPSDDELSGSTSPVDTETHLTISEAEIPSKLEELTQDYAFSRSRHLTFSTLQIILRRIGDKNVLPHLHVLLSFLSSFASIPYVSPLIRNAPWSELATFLNTLIKSETSEPLIPSPVFPSSEKSDRQPLPEDYLFRGQIWSQWYFPENWFGGEHDEEERSLELASTVKSRIERIIRLGGHIASFERWITYDQASRTFSVVETSEESAQL